MEFTTFEQLLDKVRGKTNRVVVPGANNSEALEAIKMADDAGLISEGILIGDPAAVKPMAEKAGLDMKKFRLVDVKDVPEMCMTAVRMIVNGEGDFLCKGLVDTKFYMKAILNKEFKLVPEGRLLSHFVLYRTPRYHKFFAVTDSAIVPHPTREQKIMIIENAVSIMHKLGNAEPKVSLVCPVEKPSDKVPSTMEAVELVKMNREGKITGAVIEGPYDIYISFSKQLASEKGIKDSKVAGDVDIAVFPDLDAANPVYKCICFFGEKVQSAAILAGAKIPAILPSRADSPDTKLLSIALACYLKDKK